MNIPEMYIPEERSNSDTILNKGVDSIRGVYSAVMGKVNFAKIAIFGSQEEVQTLVHNKLEHLPLGVGDHLVETELLEKASNRLSAATLDIRRVFALATPVSILSAVAAGYVLGTHEVSRGGTLLGAPLFGEAMGAITRCGYLIHRACSHYRRHGDTNPWTIRLAAMSIIPVVGTALIPAVGLVGAFSGEEMTGITQVAMANLEGKPVIQKAAYFWNRLIQFQGNIC